MCRLSKFEMCRQTIENFLSTYLSLKLHFSQIFPCYHFISLDTSKRQKAFLRTWKRQRDSTNIIPDSAAFCFGVVSSKKKENMMQTLPQLMNVSFNYEKGFVSDDKKSRAMPFKLHHLNSSRHEEETFLVFVLSKIIRDSLHNAAAIRR